MKNYLKLTLLSLVVVACGPSTEIVSSFKAPGVTQVNYKKVFISALTANNSAKATVENSIANGLANRGIAAVKSLDVFPPDFHASGKDKDDVAVVDKIKATGCDGILTIALVDKETQTNYVQGSYPSYYGSFRGYYGYGYGSFYSPGYYTEEKVYYLETNIYDVQSGKLVYSTRSKTVSPSSLESFMEGYQKAMSERMVKDGLVQPTAKPK
jgi:hypothetical protein